MENDFFIVYVSARDTNLHQAWVVAFKILGLRYSIRIWNKYIELYAHSILFEGLIVFLWWANTSERPAYLPPIWWPTGREVRLVFPVLSPVLSASAAILSQSSARWKCLIILFKILISLISFLFSFAVLVHIHIPIVTYIIETLLSVPPVWIGHGCD